MTHLWEINHPYYGAEGYTNEADSFAELRASVDDSDPDMNHVYRWDWVDYTQPYADTLFLDDEERDKQRFYVYLAMPRKNAFWSISCPIAHDQEPEILEWLRGPRVLGALRTLWQPLLDEQAEGDSAGPASSSASLSGTGGLDLWLDDLVTAIGSHAGTIARTADAIREALEGQRRAVWDTLVDSARRQEQVPSHRQVGYTMGLRTAYDLLTGRHLEDYEYEALLAAELDSRYGTDRAKGGGSDG